MPRSCRPSSAWSATACSGACCRCTNKTSVSQPRSRFAILPTMDLTRLQGIFVPMLTPINSDETVDEPSLRRLVDFLVDAGVHGIWAMGTTGEFAAFPEQERAKAVEATVEQVNGRVPVIGNIGDSSTT